MKPSQLIDFTQFAIEKTRSALIVGPPGVGKTAIISQACALAGADLIISHPIVSDPTDYKGLPFPDQDGSGASFLPFGDLKKLITTTKRTVFFIDDLGQAPPSVAAAIMQLVWGGQINGHHVSPEVTFMAASNRREDKAHVQGLIEPVKSRFTIIDLESDKDDWLMWAHENKMPPELIAFINYRPSLLFDFKPTKDFLQSPCPRNVSEVGKWQNDGLPLSMEFEVFKGRAGEPFAVEYTAFLKMYRNLPDIDSIINNPDSAPIPRGEPGIMYALAGALAHKMDRKNIANIFKYLNRLPQDIAAAAVTLGTKPKDKQHLQETTAFTKWSVANQQVLL